MSGLNLIDAFHTLLGWESFGGHISPGGLYASFLKRSLRALPTETKVESVTSESKRGTSVQLSNSGESGADRPNI